VDVGHDYVLDRQLGRLPNRCTQALSVDQATTWIHHRYGGTANNESDVGYCVFVLRGDVFVDATPDVNSRRDFLGDKRAQVLTRKREHFARVFLRERAHATDARATE
jgi:hypothetical protein